MKLRAIYLTAVALMIASPAQSAGWSGFGQCRPVGTWFINVNFPGTPIQFNGLISFHFGGTLTETNQGLHANSFPDPDGEPAPPPAPPPVNGSDGHGTWTRLRGCRIQWSFTKLVFSGPNPAGMAGPPAGTPIGYLRSRAKARIIGDQYQTIPGTTSTELLIGPDPLNPDEVIPFGESVSVGYRLYSTD